MARVRMDGAEYLIQKVQSQVRTIDLKIYILCSIYINGRLLQDAIGGRRGKLKAVELA